MEFERERERSRGIAGGGQDDARVPGRATQVEAFAPLQRKARDTNGVADGAEQLVGAAANGTGSTLPAPLQRKFEGSLGTELAGVAVHHDGAAASAADAVGARAFALGQHIYFGAGQYDPASEAGQHLIAHEVAHTVQQRGGTPTRQHKLAVSGAHDASEHEADRAADAMVRGAPARVGSVGGAIHRFPLNGIPDPQDPGLGDVRRVVAVNYPGGLLGACPSLPRRTSNPVFAQLGSAYGEYDAAKRVFDKQLPQLTALLAYTPDLTGAMQAIQKDAQTPASGLRNQALLLNDRRVKLNEIRANAATEVATLTSQATAAQQLQLTIGEQAKAIQEQWTTMIQKAKAEDHLESLKPSIGEIINGVGTVGGAALGLSNVVGAEVIKIGTSLAIGDPQMQNGGARRTATADIAGQGSANIVGFLGAIVEEITGVAGKRRELEGLIKRFEAALAQKQQQINCFTLLNQLTQLQLAERTIMIAIDNLKRLGGEYEKQLKAIAQVEQDRDSAIDAKTGGKLKDLKSHIDACRAVESAAAGICDASLIGLGGKGPALVGALDAAAAVPPTPATPAAPAPRDRNPFDGPDVLPPRATQTAPASEDPVPASLAGEAKALSGTVQAVIASADSTKQQARAKRDDLSAAAANLVGAAEVDDPRLP